MQLKAYHINFSPERLEMTPNLFKAANSLHTTQHKRIPYQTRNRRSPVNVYKWSRPTDGFSWGAESFAWTGAGTGRAVVGAAAVAADCRLTEGSAGRRCSYSENPVNSLNRFIYTASRWVHVTLPLETIQLLTWSWRGCARLLSEAIAAC